jgi:predicted DNA-binding protein (MmcQ/YjbR family)
MKTHKEIEEYLLRMPNVWLDYPFGKDVAVYKIGGVGGIDGHKGTADGDTKEGKMFALVTEGKEPVQISLKCDPILAETLREKYETVQPGYHLNKKHWNTLLLTGQLPWDEVQALIQHSYDLVVA